jgi:hypothetical protein
MGCMNLPLSLQRAAGAETKVTHTLRQPLRILETSSQLPTHADVVVIGGGIIGVFAAYYMARRGLSVALVEKGCIGAEQSSRNWGLVPAAEPGRARTAHGDAKPRALGTVRRRQR